MKISPDFRSFRRRSWVLLLALAGLATTACDDDIEPPYTLTGDGGFTVIGAPPSGLQTKYAPGEVVGLRVGFNAADKVREFTVFQVIGRTDSAVVTTLAPSNVFFEPAAGLSIQVIPYQVPANLANQTAVRVDVTTTFENGATRRQRFSYNVAATPTLRFGTTASPTTITTFRNNLAGSAQSENDIIGFNLVLNEGGIGTLPTAPSTARLFKSVDSLTTFYRIGNGAPVRTGVIRNPSNGAANARTVDVVVPRGSEGQAVTFLFTAYSGPYFATAGAAPVNVVPPTALSRVRTGRVTAGPSAPQDSVAFDLRLGTNVPNSAPAATKDLFASGVLGTTVSLSSANTTVYYRIPVATAAAGYYTTASANAVGILLFQNSASLVGTAAVPGNVAAGDLFAVRVRGAEPMLLRITGVKPSTAGSTARVAFEYRAF
ncbi:hypothetical protein [Hymenobacter psychrophilus]|uniref:DUF4397 domain-containing protein n=1 Tax=Hymenobacter psychrophilus TaxID=651662 RepID=A0A1H3AR12_9BACT|nr:hypothetical protein [Hymenobacter psychrophilus]SDX32045.1 hypothetical protein SAMN04488069_1017 [Hymenobacter psychrophilus]